AAFPVEPRRPHLDVRVPARGLLLAQDQPAVPPEQVHELVVGAPAGPVEVEDLDGLGHASLPRVVNASPIGVSAASRAASARSSAHAPSTWRSVVRRLPTARRIVNRLRSRVCDRNTSPVRFTASISRVLRSSRRSGTSPSSSRPATDAGRYRKQTVENGTGARRSQSGSPPTHSASRAATAPVAATRRA